MPAFQVQNSRHGLTRSVEYWNGATKGSSVDASVQHHGHTEYADIPLATAYVWRESGGVVYGEPPATHDHNHICAPLLRSEQVQILRSHSQEQRSWALRCCFAMYHWPPTTCLILLHTHALTIIHMGDCINSYASFCAPSERVSKSAHKSQSSGL